jgi:hypothetical protein
MPRSRSAWPCASRCPSRPPPRAWISCWCWGLDFLLVLGVRDAPDGTTQLVELFDAHHYTSGLSFVPTETPTNNTLDAPSGFSSNDPGHGGSYQAERAAPVPGAGSNAVLLASALRLPDTGPFANLPHAAAKEALDDRHMNTVLWPATWGYFLLQMLGVGGPAVESPLTDDDIAWLRGHFIEHVRASGPLPALRIGKQPYGVLPVTSLDAWKPPAGQEALLARDTALRDFLLRLRDLWRRNVPDVPRLGRTDDTPQEQGIDRDLAEVLSMDGRSSSFSLRNLMGRHYLEHLHIYLTAPSFVDVWDVEPQTLQERNALNFSRRLKRRAVTQWWTTQQAQTDAVLPSLGVGARPRLSRAVYAPSVATLRGALVQADPATSLTPNYLTALLAARDLDDIRSERVVQPPPRTLLYLLVRHAMLQEYAAAASRLLLDRGLLQPAQRREPELVDFPLGE